MNTARDGGNRLPFLQHECFKEWSVIRPFRVHRLPLDQSHKQSDFEVLESETSRTRSIGGVAPDFRGEFREEKGTETKQSVIGY